MIITMHGLSTMHCNLRTDIRIAGETGYQGIEIVEGKLLRYLDCGYRAEDLLPLLKAQGVRAVCINALKSIERVEPAEREELMATAERLCAAAEVLGCPTLQLVPFTGLQGRSWDEVLALTARNVADIAAIGKRHHVRFQIEPIAWAPIHSLSQSLQLREEAGAPDNVGMVIDFWHLTAGEATTPDEVARLDGRLIYGVHFCDGVRHVHGTPWDEGKLRAYLPGEGRIPIAEWVAAVRATGFDGVWSSELYSPKHWELDAWEAARVCKTLLEHYLGLAA